jgi:CubicO group peptidase (beta-lactamase class C family)
MKPVRLALAGLLIATLAPAPANAQEPAVPTAAASELNGLDSYIDETVRAWNVPGVAVSVVKDGRVVLARGYGARDPVSHQPMTADTIFPIASMSKAFTTFGAGLLADEGRLSFDEPVRTYLKGFAMRDPAATNGLTLRDMFSHRSGLPRHDSVFWDNGALTRAGLLERLAYLEPSKPLRSAWQYNNIIFILGGLAVERVAGESWEEFTTHRIFEPLQMRRSFFGYERALADPDHATGRETVHGKPVPVPLVRNTPINNPAGGVYSTARDLANWMLVHVEHGRFGERQLIQDATLEELHRTQMALGATARDPEDVPVGYALGWFTNLYRGRAMVQHGGNLTGVSTLAAMIPSERLGVVVLVNQGESELRDVLARQIIDRFLGATGKDWVGEALQRKRAGEAAEAEAGSNKSASRVSGTKPSRPLADFVGEYRNPGYGLLTVRLENGRLIGRYNDDSTPLSHWHYDVFAADTADPDNVWIDQRVQFVTDMAGHVSGAQSAMEPTLSPIMFDRQPDAILSDADYLRGLTGVYELAGRKVTIALAGDRLTFTNAGGSPALLLPSLGGEFVHERHRDARIRFRADAAGRADAMIYTDMEGVYEARRISRH